MNNDDRLNQQINRLIKSSDPVEVKQIYQDWAPNYESDLAGHGYVAPQYACEQLAELLDDHNALIYDAGCGTGLVGKLLGSRGFKRLHGADFSPDMLAQAGISGAYESLTQADYSAPVDIKSAHYDAVISVGVYSARFSGYFIPEMLRILKPGGLFLFTCRELYFDQEVSSELNALLENAEISNLNTALRPYLLGQSAQAWFVSLRKTAK